MVSSYALLGVASGRGCQTETTSNNTMEVFIKLPETVLRRNDFPMEVSSKLQLTEHLGSRMACAAFGKVLPGAPSRNAAGRAKLYIAVAFIILVNADTDGRLA